MKSVTFVSENRFHPFYQLIEDKVGITFRLGNVKGVFNNNELLNVKIISRHV